MENTWISSFNNENFELIIFLTEKCNFKCVYCYEDFKLGKIKQHTVEAIKLLLLQRLRLTKNLSISYFGGEPLMNKKTLFELSLWIKNLCIESGIKNHSSITTNGYYLDKETFNSLVENGINSFQITLDGDESLHNQLRPTLKGQGTFNKIFHNLKLMLQNESKFQCTLRFNVSDNSIQSVVDFINKYGEPFINDSRFNFHFHPIFGMESLKITNDNSILILKSLVLKNGQSIESYDNNNVCYASKANSFVIRADGKIQKCTVATNSELNDIGLLKNNGEMQLDNDKLKRWIFAEDKSCPVASFQVQNLVIPYEGAGKYLQTGN